ncbi:DUF1446-domain-containing protein [Aspergillus sclerotiicarbonarius CBS 121057]|uniref:DUF1446-domain-containing protein n=1 Tax=Aspergillus sclerotiicarbonarius (strain CBS 121057 / IBT 28362) TaxID=1448318 RepID=A0A319ENI8_ASPSB|nr:DUF1446-domain-containing protein [Aspergillus sclerotiicarbonarius CBS 121057]
MPTFYQSITPELRDWALRQSVFFVASAPLQGRHVNVSPKGFPDSSFAILGPNEAAYVDATGSGSETISHVRENGRVTVMFCSFDASPGIVRFFCIGSVIEWDEPEFPSYLERMGGKHVVGARAIIRLNVFKAQHSCGYGVPRLSLKVDPETKDANPFLQDRNTLGHWTDKKVRSNELRAYQKEYNVRSLDGLPGLHTALKDNHQLIWLKQVGNWARRHRDEIEMVKTSILILFISMAILQWAGYLPPANSYFLYPVDPTASAASRSRSPHLLNQTTECPRHLPGEVFPSLIPIHRTKSPERAIKPLGASGSNADRRHAIAEFARNYPQDPVDVIIADFMSEANMVAAAARKVDQDQLKEKGGQETPTHNAPGYEAAFLLALSPALEDLAKHRIKVAVNAGNADTEGLYKVVRQMVEAKGLNLKVAWVSGDEVLSTVKAALLSGKSTFNNIYTGQSLSDCSFEPIFAQCYLGGLGIAAALSQGADIVLCGRVSDASPVIGAAYWFHNWNRTDLDQLANAFVAGHLIECSNYVCGGNFTGFKTLEHVGRDGWTNIGYPIAEISPAGKVIITMQSYATGGAITVDTCSSQLLYEIQGPWYFNSDVTAILNDIHFEQVGTNRVAVHGIRSGPPPPTTKVGITARGGFQAEATWFLVGLDIDAKARMLEAQIRHLLSPYSSKFTALHFSTLGSATPNPKDQDSATVCFRIVAQARHADDLSPMHFLRHIVDNIMQGYPGATFHLDSRQGFPRPIYEYHVSLLPQSSIHHRVHLPWLHQTLTIPPPPTTKTYPPHQPSQPITSAPYPITSTSFGPTTPAPLGWIVHARSGDKGPDANCGFWVRHSDEYLWLRTLLSITTIKDLLGEKYTANPDLRIERFELPNMRAVHFLFRNLLDRGVGVTTTVDFLGKNVAEFLRARVVDVPVGFLGRGKL